MSCDHCEGLIWSNNELDGMSNFLSPLILVFILISHPIPGHHPHIFFRPFFVLPIAASRAIASDGKRAVAHALVGRVINAVTTQLEALLPGAVAVEVVSSDLRAECGEIATDKVCGGSASLSFYFYFFSSQTVVRMCARSRSPNRLRTFCSLILRGPTRPLTTSRNLFLLRCSTYASGLPSP